MISPIGVIELFRELNLSKTLIVQAHPCFVVEEIAARHGTELVFTYSRYKVASPGLQATAPRSSVFRAAAPDVTPTWLADRFAELDPSEEMAWHSWVECRGSVFHIPMIDFVDRPAHSVVCEVGRVLSERMNLRGDFVFFETGSSFHGYFPDLITEDAWRKYLGQLLLLNEPDRSPIIDNRWIGHALMRGYAALRWSHNTNRYRAIPRLVSVHVPESSKAEVS